MANTSRSSILKLRNLLNIYCNHIDTQISLNKVSVRYLRGSRYGKNNTQDDLKYQRLLKALKYESEPLTSKVENTSKELKEDASENVPKYSSDQETSRVTPEDLIRKLDEKMNPLKHLVYTKQLEKKHKKSANVLKLLGEKLLSLNVPIAMGNDKLPCPLDYVVPSPVTEGYRNRDEFNIGLGLDGNEKTIGWFLDHPTEFSTPFCISPTELSFVRESHKNFIEDLQNYIKLSDLPATQHFTDKGYWKNVIVRSNSAGHVMGIVVMHPQDLNQEELQIEKEKLKEYFSCMPNSSYNLQSLYFQTCTQSRCTHEQSPFELIMGDPFIIEESNNLVFHITPDSFFHINTKAAEATYHALLKMCRVNKNTTVMDIGCGIGHVSLLFSPRVKNCIGIDDYKQSIIDAKLNAMENRSQNVEFIHGKLDATVKDVLSSEFSDELLIIVNSSRSSINTHFMSCLREFKNIDRIVYVTTKPEGAIDNFVKLCKPQRSSRNLGKAFLPIFAVPFDICPHSEQYGLITMFQRL